MFVEAIKLINLPLAAEDTLSKIGTIRQIFVDHENGHILGFLLAKGFFSPAKVITIKDIKYWDLNGLVTETEENIVNIDDIVRIKKIFENEINLFDIPAETESGKKLGTVNNFLIDTDAEMIVKYYLEDLFGDMRVMPADKVIKIDKKIIFADDEAEIESGIAETQTA